MTKFSIIFLVSLMACSPKIVSFTQSDADRASEKFPGSTLATLTEGQNHYKQYCGSCHPHKSPTAKNEEQWKVIVPKMVIKANKKAGKQAINAEMEQSITTYLVTMCTAPKK